MVEVTLDHTMYYKNSPRHSSNISCPTRTVSFDCNNTVLNTLNLLGSSDTVSDSALNGPPANDPFELSTTSNIFLEMTPSVYNICVTSIGKEIVERMSKYFRNTLQAGTDDSSKNVKKYVI